MELNRKELHLQWCIQFMCTKVGVLLCSVLLQLQICLIFWYWLCYHMNFFFYFLWFSHNFFFSILFFTQDKWVLNNIHLLDLQLYECSVNAISVLPYAWNSRHKQILTWLDVWLALTSATCSLILLAKYFYFFPSWPLFQGEAQRISMGLRESLLPHMII